MRYKIKTLIDITPTGARKGDNIFKYKQDQNHTSFVNSIQMRSNVNTETVTSNKVSIANMGFGEKYKGRQMVWEMEFHFDQEGSHHPMFMRKDLDLVPVFTGLNETIKCPTKAFIIDDDNYCNTIIEEIDK